MFTSFMMDDQTDNTSSKVSELEPEVEEDEEVDDQNDDANNQSPNSNHIIQFRSYSPQTNLLDGLYSSEKIEPLTITKYIEDKLSILKESESTDQDVDNVYKIDPEMLELKKVDWDLKRRLEKRMEKLDRETRKHIDRHIKGQRN